ncbi:MAG: hypothetical protein Q9168_006100 [Polycauliona sp. 1 TL-2023]
MASDPDPERDAATRTDNKDHSPAKLIKFRHMTGIDTPPTLHNRDPKRPAKNQGVYTRIVWEERHSTFQYYLMSSIINAAFMGQIIIAASLTALGAANGSRLAITVLGSINTVIAGVQTYLKGQGLPNRIKQYQFGLRKLREYIEDRERDFSHEGCPLDVDHVIADVAAMYQAVRQTAEDNTPETYLPMGGAGKKLLGDKANAKTPIEMLGTSPYALPEVASTSNSGNTGRRPQGKSGVEEDGEATPLLNH